MKKIMICILSDCLKHIKIVFTCVAPRYFITQTTVALTTLYRLRYRQIEKKLVSFCLR